ncbi:putative phosphatidylethanolamine transferase Mcr-1 [Ephemeroptericola cinctiostellae]|uniref:Putative phosphatidylethanolamine transferase Mcr-1 n=1 Tax=Ephemeroptericola cinctiostellae TaxID=2268024 RepID=A0A345DAN5_9BURK|nr:phosphoethanolamine--lipid A transferase [Ephemeroptericola cinctiostellae]AXF85423.1 putative phosphatidylethanolamine transferase Mcr-1 [Ephemeroptericola cinctiostellae]
MNRFLQFLKTNATVLTAALGFTLFYNWSFFNHFNQAYSTFSLPFFISIGIMLFSATALVLSLICYRRTTKPILMLLFIIAAFCAYYMNTYDIIVDKTMIQNVVQTNVNEAKDLFTWKMVGYALVLGVLPAWIVSRVHLPKTTFKAAFSNKFKLIALLLILMASQAFGFSKNYSSFFREHKLVRFYANPITPVYSAIQFAIKSNTDSAPKVVTPLGEDAKKSATDSDRHLTILVVGETARADHFSLNGYAKDTNPLLAKEQVVSLHNLSSCGTSTAVSVPCMFSGLGRANYDEKKFNASENLLDVLNRAGVSVLWRDNNSDSKGVATRLTYQDYKDPKINTICDTECRDEGLLVGLQDYIDQHKTGDITIVLHQMGSHGPAYYSRYTKAFEKFTPACQTNLLEKCSVEEISNAFDNTIVATDYFLSKVIALLKPNAKNFQTAMVYMSDHGESLGENGVYLHGMPYAIAPEAQKHPASIIWLGDGFKALTFDQLKQKADAPLSHDNLFSTLLGLNKIETKLYDPKMDFLKP